MIIYQLLRNLPHFSFEKGHIKYLFINKHDYIYLKKLEVQQIKYLVSKWTLDSAIIPFLSLYFMFFKGFVYVNVFCTCWEIPSNLIVSRK